MKMIDIKDIKLNRKQIMLKSMRWELYNIFIVPNIRFNKFFTNIIGINLMKQILRIPSNKYYTIIGNTILKYD